MHPELRRFVAEMLGTVALALLPVILASFLLLPMNLVADSAATGGEAASQRHLT